MAEAKQSKPIMRFWRTWLSKQKAILAFAAIMMVIVAFAVSAQSFMVGFVIDALANLGTNPDKIIKFGFSAKQIAFYGPIAVVIISLLRGIGSVSYTHLDVYKRQIQSMEPAPLSRDCHIFQFRLHW